MILDSDFLIRLFPLVDNLTKPEYAKLDTTIGSASIKRDNTETIYNNKNCSPTNQSSNKTNSPHNKKKKKPVTSNINLTYRGTKRNKRSYRDKGKGNNVNMRKVTEKK